MQGGHRVTSGHCSCLQPIWGVMLRQVKSIFSFIMTYPFLFRQWDLNLESICSQTRNTHKHGVVFPNLEQENEAGKILGNWYSLPAIHLNSPATWCSVLLALHTLPGYLLITCTNSTCITELSWLELEKAALPVIWTPHHCSLYWRWLWFVFVDLQAKRQKTWYYLLIQLIAATVKSFTELVAQVYEDQLPTFTLTMVRTLLRTPRVIERWSRGTSSWWVRIKSQQQFWMYAMSQILCCKQQQHQYSSPGVCITPVTYENILNLYPDRGRTHSSLLESENMAGTDRRFKHAVPHETGTGKCLGRMCEEEGQHRSAWN